MDYNEDQEVFCGVVGESWKVKRLRLTMEFPLSFLLVRSTE